MNGMGRGYGEERGCGERGCGEGIVCFLCAW